MHLCPETLATYLIILVFPADVGPYNKTGSYVPAIALKKSLRCYKNVYVK